MKDILITVDCFVKGEPVSAGDTLEGVDNSTAAELLSSGRAVVAKTRKTIKPADEVKPKPVSKKTAKKKSAKKID